MTHPARVTHDPIDTFIENWGLMGVHWGVGKVMAEIHALLYLSKAPLSLEHMSARLKTSRSNISLNVRALQDLGVVRKVILPGDRKDYYTAEGNLGRVARRLAAKKKKRELDPGIRIVEEAIENAAKDPGSGMSIEKLRELKELMEGIASVFEAFIGEEHAEDAEPTRAGIR